MPNRVKRIVFQGASKYTMCLGVILSLVLAISIGMSGSVGLTNTYASKIIKNNSEQAVTPRPVALISRLLVDDVDYRDLTESTLPQKQIRFSVLEGSQPDMIIERIEVSAHNDAAFIGGWALKKSKDGLPSEVFECSTCGKGETTLIADLSQAGKAISGVEARAGDVFELDFTDEYADNESYYSYKVYARDKTETDVLEESAANAGTNVPASDDPAVIQPRAYRASNDYVSAWKRNVDTELASNTHTLSVLGNSRARNPKWKEEFELGGDNGAAISRIDYRFEGNEGAQLLLQNTQRNTNFKINLDGILDSQEFGQAEVLYTPSREPMGAWYPIKTAGGPVLLYARVSRLLQPGSDNIDRSSAGITIAFFKKDKRTPTNLEFPARTKVSLEYTWAVNGKQKPVAEQASLVVKGSSTGVTESPMLPGGADPAFQQCSESGGTVWVGMSAHSNPDQTFNDRNTTQLYEQKYGQTIFHKIGAPTNWVYNALAYNPLDGYLYGISQGRIKTPRSVSPQSTYDEDPNYPAGHLLKISPINGTVEDAGRITGIQSQRVGTWPNDLWGGITSGVIMADGTYAFSNSSKSGTHNLYTLDLSKSANRAARRFANTDLRSNDYTYSGDASNGYIYGIRNNNSVLERIDLKTGAIATVNLQGLKDALGNSISTGIYGTAWTYANGNLGFGKNGQKRAYQIKIKDETSTSFNAELVSVSPAPTSQSNDAASNALKTGEADLNINKKLISNTNGKAEWEITVTNVGPCGSSGFSVKDIVPDKYKEVKVQHGTAGWISDSQTKDVNGNVVLALHGSLKQGESAKLRLTATYDQKNDTCVENTASVLGNEKDPQNNNNQASDGGCALIIRKEVVDADGNNVIDAADTALPGNSPDTRSIDYVIKVTNPDKKRKNTYTLLDKPQFADLVTVTGAEVAGPDDSNPRKISQTIINNDAYFKLVENKEIEAGGSHTYTIKVFYTHPKGDADYSNAECVAGSTAPRHGLYNEAIVNYAGGTIRDDACGPIVKNSDVTLFIQKVDAANQAQTLSGSEFTIYESGDGETLGNKVAELNQPDEKNGFLSAILQKDTKYFLVETKSPKGYSLLPQPIGFVIVVNEDGNAVVQLSDKTASASVVNDVVNVAPSPTNAYISVADVHQGELPKTGGSGVMPWVMAALVAWLMAAARVFRTREGK